MHSIAVPRLLISAPASNAGKTTVTCALLRAFKRRKLALLACKCGPDYIDPLFHTQVIGVPSRNIDLFFAGKELARALLAHHGANADLVLMEGAMGFFDGIGISDRASAWDSACATDTPCVLVVDARGRARSIAAEVAGYAHFREPSMVRGVILNRLSPMMFDCVKASIEEETGIPVLGYLPVLPNCAFESRHLGLVTAPEIADLTHKLDTLADAAEKSIDLDALLKLARKTSPLELEADASSPVAMAHLHARTHNTHNAATDEETPDAAYADRSRTSAHGEYNKSGEDGLCPRPIIAVARDKAFCFYYADTLDLLESLGAVLVEFSLLADKQLPEGTCGLYLGGGYPELHAQELSENVCMRNAVHGAVENGMPTIAECGGFLYLHDTLRTSTGETFPLAGVIPADAFPTQKLGRFGYVTLTAHEDNLLALCGEQLRAHEFHYWDSASPGSSFTAAKPLSERSWECVHANSTLYAGFPHLYLPAYPSAAERFVKECAAYAERETSITNAAGTTGISSIKGTADTSDSINISLPLQDAPSFQEAPC